MKIVQRWLNELPSGTTDSTNRQNFRFGHVAWLLTIQHLPLKLAEGTWKFVPGYR